MRIGRPDGDEVLRAGDVYYLEPGHVPIFEEDTEVLEFSSRDEYANTIEAAARSMARGRRTADDQP